MSITHGFELHGRFTRCANQKETLIQALTTLGSAHPELLPRLVEEFSGGPRGRHYVASDRWRVYPRRPDLAHLVEELLPGYFVGTNENADTKLKILMHACRLAGLQYGTDFRAMCLEHDGRQRRKLQHSFANCDRMERALAEWMAGPG